MVGVEVKKYVCEICSTTLDILNDDNFIENILEIKIFEGICLKLTSNNETCYINQILSRHANELYNTTFLTNPTIFKQYYFDDENIPEFAIIDLNYFDGLNLKNIKKYLYKIMEYGDDLPRFYRGILKNIFYMVDGLDDYDEWIVTYEILYEEN